jgi:methyl-accepting chemotaxis protein
MNRLIVESSAAQNEVVANVATAIERVRDVANDTAQGAHQIAASSNQLRTTADQMKTLVERFQIDGAAVAAS